MKQILLLAVTRVGGVPYAICSTVIFLVLGRELGNQVPYTIP